MTSTTSAICAAIGLATVGGLTALKTPGDKDVNVVNTPDVRVVNTPTVNVGNTVAVSVQESRIPVHFRRELQGNAITQELPMAQRYVVPDGKRLVITHVSGVASMPPSQSIIAVSIIVYDDFASYRQHNLVLGPKGPTATTNLAQSYSQPMNLVAESGDTVGFFFGRTNNEDSTIVTMNVSGYLQDTP